MYVQDLVTITHMSRSSLDLQKLLTSWVSHPLRRKFPQPRNSFVNRLFLLFLFKSTPYPWLWITWPLEWSFLLPYLWVKYNLIGLFHLKIYLSPTCWLWNICEPALENNCHPSPVLDKLFCCAQEQTDIHHLELFERREQWHLEEEKNAVYQCTFSSPGPLSCRKGALIFAGRRVNMMLTAPLAVQYILDKWYIVGPANNWQ